jgi:hypothetical protein
MVIRVRPPQEVALGQMSAEIDRIRRSIWLPAAIILLIHAVWIGAYFAAGHEIRDFIKIGSVDVRRSQASPLIKYDPTYRYPPNHDAPNGTGFDGQYSYFIAVDPPKARFYIDASEASYRYTRILYPMVARALAIGQAPLIPYTLLLVNWLAMGLGTFALAAWLRRRGTSPWWSLIYGLYPGFLVSMQRDLTEPLAYALVAVAIYCFDFAGRRRLLWAGVAFSLAALAREVTLVFALMYGLAIFPHSWRAALRFLALVVGPLAMYELFLLRWLGQLSAGGGISLLPFGGLLGTGELQLSRQPPEILGVILPALACAALAVRALLRRLIRIEIVTLLANIMVLVVIQPASVYIAYTSIGRATAGVVLAALTCVPYVPQLKLRSRLSALAPVAGWLSLWPAVLWYGFATSLRP